MHQEELRYRRDELQLRREAEKANLETQERREAAAAAREEIARREAREDAREQRETASIASRQSDTKIADEYHRHDRYVVRAAFSVDSGFDKAKLS